METSSVSTPDWTALPAPTDDRAAKHLLGMQVPSIALVATDGSSVDLAALKGRTVVFLYPRSGRPNEPNPEGWDLIPGARGCTPQACAFRDLFAELKSLGAQQLFGLSTQSTAWQREAVERLHLPFPLLSDEFLRLTSSLKLPVFETNGMTLLKRMTLILRNGLIEHLFYPVFPPDRNAADVAEWLKSH
jgi:peroxiredoxin